MIRNKIRWTGSSILIVPSKDGQEVPYLRVMNRCECLEGSECEKEIRYVIVESHGLRPHNAIDSTPKSHINEQHYYVNKNLVVSEYVVKEEEQVVKEELKNLRLTKTPSGIII